MMAVFRFSIKRTEINLHPSKTNLDDVNNTIG